MSRFDGRLQNLAAHVTRGASGKTPSIHWTDHHGPFSPPWHQAKSSLNEEDFFAQPVSVLIEN